MFAELLLTVIAEARTASQSFSLCWSAVGEYSCRERDCVSVLSNRKPEPQCPGLLPVFSTMFPEISPRCCVTISGRIQSARQNPRFGISHDNLDSATPAPSHVMSLGFEGLNYFIGHLLEHRDSVSSELLNKVSRCFDRLLWWHVEVYHVHNELEHGTPYVVSAGGARVYPGLAVLK
jgi:hypothetical protein